MYLLFIRRGTRQWFWGGQDPFGGALEGVGPGNLFFSFCMRLAATRVHFACDWRPHGYILHAIGGHTGTICMRLAATRVQFVCDWPSLGYNLNATGRQSHAKPPVFWKQMLQSTFLCRITQARPEGCTQRHKMTPQSKKIQLSIIYIAWTSDRHKKES